MTEEEKQKIRALFAYVIRMLKSNHEMTARVSAELAALMGAVRGLDPTFVDVMEEKRLDVDQIGDPLVRASLDQYDDMIHRVEIGEFL